MNPGQETLVRSKPKLAKGVTGLLLVAFFGFFPFQMGVDSEGWIKINASVAHAESGPGKDGDGGGGHGGGHGGDDDHDDDDDDDDGSGGDNSGSGSNNSGSGSEGNSNRSGIVRIKLTATGVEIRYADGAREIIKNGCYRYKSASGKIVISRRATGADLARLRARANGVSTGNISRPSQPNPANVNAASISGNNIRLTYTNGWTEEISSGRYLLRDQYNRTVVSRPARKADIQRMRQVAGR